MKKSIIAILVGSILLNGYFAFDVLKREVYIVAFSAGMEQGSKDLSKWVVDTVIKENSLKITKDNGEVIILVPQAKK